MNTILQFTAPPLLGAFIGYMTNYVAIKMLFRPLHPWRIFGLRIPMTPGVIPSKRHELAQNIGEMVGEHLLTSHDMSRAIHGEQFQHHLRGLIDRRFDGILHQDLGPIYTVIPKRFHAYFRASIKILRLRFISQLHAYLDSKAFAETIQELVSAEFDLLLARNLEDTFSRESRDHFNHFVEKTLGDLLAGPAVREWLADQIQQKINTFLAEQRTVNDIIPPELSELILDRLEEEAPHIIAKLATLLEEPAMQEKIAATIGRAINNFTESLGPIASMMTSFVSPETIQRKVSEYLADKGEEIGQWLSDPAIREQVARLLREKAEEILETPLATLLKDVSLEKLNNLSGDISRRFSELMARPATMRAISGALDKVLSTQSKRPISDILHDLFGGGTVNKGRNWTAAEIVTILRSTRVKQLLDHLVVELIEKKLLAKPIGVPADLLPRKVQDTCADYLLQQVNDLLIREVPGLVDSLNIKKIVSRKVDSLDLLRLEGLLMSIMEEQFKYINLFGALLGFFIGLVNLVLLTL